MIQHRVERFILNKPWHKLSHDHDSVTEMLTNLGWSELEQARSQGGSDAGTPSQIIIL